MTFLLYLAGGATAAEAADGHARSNVAVATFLVFVAATLLITVWAARRTHSRKDFYAAGSRMNWVQNGLAIFGDAMSAAGFLGIAGLFFLAGYDTLYFTVGLMLGWAVVLLLIAERLRSLGSYTFADVVSMRLAHGPVRILAACTTLGVTIPYLIAQMVAAGALVESLFGLSYTQGVFIVGVLMTVYVAVGGMIATTWVQIVKAVLLLVGATALTLGVFVQFGFDINALFNAAAASHPEGAKVFRPGLLYPDAIAVITVVLSCVAGTAGLPHVLMRFFTVPDALQARRSAMLALSLVGCLQIMVLFIGMGAMVYLVGHPQYSTGGTNLVGDSNMAAIHLSAVIGGPAFMGFVAAVSFATILAVVSGLTLSAAATISHDLYSQVICRGASNEKQELRISRATALVLGITAVLLSLLFEGQNVAVLATLPLAVTASTNFPILLLAMYWRGFTTRGALVGGYCGLFVSLLLILLGPNVWVQALGFERPIFPYAYPTIFSMPLGFALAWYFSVSDRSERAGTERIEFDTKVLAAVNGRSL